MELEYVAEFALPVALDACSLLSCPVFGEGHGCINRLPVFTWGFLLDKLVEGIAGLHLGIPAGQVGGGYRESILLFFRGEERSLQYPLTDVIAVK